MMIGKTQPPKIEWVLLSFTLKFNMFMFITNVIVVFIFYFWLFIMTLFSANIVLQDGTNSAKHNSEDVRGFCMQQKFPASQVWYI